MMKTIFSIHIPKTAGSFFGRFLLHGSPKVLLYNYGPVNDASKLFLNGEELPLDSHEERWNFFKNISSRDEKGLAVMHGHFTGSSFLNEIAHAMYIFWVREPIDRLFSHYQYWKRQMQFQDPSAEKNLGQKRQLFRKMNPTFEQFACSPHFSNRQSDFVTNLPLNRILNIGIFENLSSSMERFSEELELNSNVEYNNFINSSPSSSLEEMKFSDDLIKKIYQQNSEDKLLYDSCASGKLSEVFYV